MKKLILIAMATLMLTACQPTPEQNIVVEKDTERMVEQAMPEDTEQTIPTISQLVPEDRYVYEETGADGKLTLTMDAEIDVPAVDYMPITEVSRAIFTQEQVTGLFNYFFPSGEATIDMPQVELKSDIERGILETKQELAQTEDAAQRQFLEEQLASMEEYYLEAPEEQPSGSISDGTLYFIDPLIDESLNLDVKNDTQTLNVTTAKTPDTNTYSVKISYRREDMLAAGYGDEPAVGEDIELTYDTAYEKCEEVFTSLGYNTDEFFVYKADPGKNPETQVFDSYRMIFSRKISGIPSFTSSVYGPSYGRGVEDDSFSVIWEYEMIEIEINNSQIYSLNWNAPVYIGETVTDNAVLKPFDEIATIYENMVTNEYEGLTSTVLDGRFDIELNTHTVQLMLVRIREQNESISGLFVPAWVFTGNLYMNNNKGLQGYTVDADYVRIRIDRGQSDEEIRLFDEEVAFPVLVVNAVDGSIIDLNKGY